MVKYSDSQRYEWHKGFEEQPEGVERGLFRAEDRRQKAE